ncbi:MAG TPA: DUF3822 family protein [Bacteroidales bacterium]|nr:DUF3822 family protein [Bacteroidales bacterium]
MHNLNLTDETFDVNQSSNYFLLMQSSLSGFSYSVVDSVRNKCILLKHFDTPNFDWFGYRNFLNTVIEGDSNLKLSYKGVSHILVTKDFTMVPDTFVSPGEDNLSLYFPGTDPQTNNFIATASEASKAVIVCPYPKVLAELLQKCFPGVRLTHLCLPFISNLINESARTLRHVFNMIINDGFITIGVAHSSRLDFINTFKAQTFEDILYYLVTVLDKFKVTPDVAEVYVQNSTFNPDIMTKLHSNIGRVRNLKASQNMVYSYIITEDLLERYANMLNLYHCE